MSLSTPMHLMERKWYQCEGFCRGLSESEVETYTSIDDQDYRQCLEKRHQKYDESFNNSSYSKSCVLLQFVVLEYLNNRLDGDYTILLKEKQDRMPLIEAAENVSLQIEGNEGSRNSLTNVTPGGKVGKTLWLKMTWDMIIFFLEIWETCRRQTIQTLEKMYEEKQNMATEMTASTSANFVGSITGETLHLEQTTTNAVLDHLAENNPYSFTRLFFEINDDIRCFNIVHNKMREFLHMMRSTECLEVLEANPEDLFLSITANISPAPQHQGNWGLDKYKEILHQKIGITLQLLSSMSGDLLHLNDLFINIGADGEFDNGIRSVINVLKQEQDATMMIYVLPCMDADEEVRMKVKEWLPHCGETTTTLTEIKDKLHKMTKDVAIAQTVGASVGIVGGALVITGIALAPVTFGASLGLSIGGGVAAGLGAATGVGASISEIVIDKSEMDKAKRCLDEGKTIFKEVEEKINNLTRMSKLVLSNLPPDEMGNRTSLNIDSGVSSDPEAVARRAISITRLVYTAGGSAIGGPIARMAIAGTIAASRTALTAVAHSFAAIGVAFDIVNLVLSSVQIARGALSESAQKLEEVVASLEEEKRVLSNWLNDT